jgi:hypothetical protein
MANFPLGTLSSEHRGSRTVLRNAAAEWRQHPVLWTLSVALFLISGAWVVFGYDYLIFHPFAVDLQMRWVEQRYVYNGQNPYDVVALVSAQREHRPLPECTRDNQIDPRIGKLYHRAGGYPPWAFPTAALFVLPTRFVITRVYFGVLNALALALTCVWAYQIGRRHSRAGGVFLAAASLAVFGHYKTLQAGQYSILVNGLLIGVYWLVEKQKPVCAGILYGMAALKPQISALFALSFLVRRQWKALVASMAYIVVASLATWALTKTNPVEMLGQMQDLARRWSYSIIVSQDPLPSRPPVEYPQGYSCLLPVLMECGMSWSTATRLGAVVGLLAAGMLMWRWRNGPTLTLFAIAATIGRLWSYHRPYDDVMLIFLVVALGQLVLARRSLGAILAFSLVGISLWTPLFGWWYTPYPLPIALWQMSSWVLGLTVLLTAQPQSCESENNMQFNPVTQDQLPIGAIADSTGGEW